MLKKSRLVFTGLVLAGFILLPSLFLLFQLNHRKNVKIHRNKVFSGFVFSQSEYLALDWQKKDEFKLEGKWYDLDRVEKVGDRYFVVCHLDKIERGFETFFDQWSGKKPDYTSGISIGNYFSFKYLPEIIASPTLSEGGDVIFAFYKSPDLLSGFEAQPYLPPEKAES
jgi:hypothetical protein